MCQCINKVYILRLVYIYFFLFISLIVLTYFPFFTMIYNVDQSLWLNNDLYIAVNAITVFSFAACVGCVAGKWLSTCIRVAWWLFVIFTTVVCIEFAREFMLKKAYAGLGGVELTVTLLLPTIGTYIAFVVVKHLPRWSCYILFITLCTSLLCLWKMNKARRRSANEWIEHRTLTS